MNWKWSKVDLASEQHVPPPRSGHSAINTGQEMVVFGGWNYHSRKYYNDVYFYNYATRQWRKSSNRNAIAGRSRHAACLLGGAQTQSLQPRMFVFGGYRGGSKTTDAYLSDLSYFDIEKEKWKTITPTTTNNSNNGSNNISHGTRYSLTIPGSPPSRRADHSMCLINGSQLLVYGGWNGERPLDDLHLFDLEKNSWYTIYDDTSLRRTTSIVEMYSSNSNNNSNYSASAAAAEANGMLHLYDASTVRPPRLYRHSACVFGSQMVLFGGISFDNIDISSPSSATNTHSPCTMTVSSNSVWILDTRTMKWNKVDATGSLPTPRNIHYSSMFGSQMVVCGGDKGHMIQDLYLLNTDIMEWSEARVSGTPPSDRHFVSYCSVGNQMYLFGGQNSQQNIIHNDLFILEATLTNEKVATRQRKGSGRSTISKYVVIKKLGYGGQGSVYLVRERERSTSNSFQQHLQSVYSSHNTVHASPSAGSAEFGFSLGQTPPPTTPGFLASSQPSSFNSHQPLASVIDSEVFNNSGGSGGYLGSPRGSFSGLTVNNHNTGATTANPVLLVLKKTVMQDLHEAHAAMEEARSLHSIKHKNIVSLRDFFVDVSCDVHYLNLIMEYCDGGDLSTFIKQQTKPIKEQVIVSMLQQLCEGLHTIHCANMIHRDLKPQNVFLTEYNRVLKIGDLGLARQMDSGSITKSVVGTPIFMSPEMWSHNNYDWSTDIWSLGLIILQLMTLKLHNIKTEIQKNENVLKDILKDVSKNYSTYLADIIEHCLRWNPRERPSAMEILDIIQQHQPQQNIGSGRPQSLPLNGNQSPVNGCTNNIRFGVQQQQLTVALPPTPIRNRLSDNLQYTTGSSYNTPHQPISSSPASSSGFDSPMSFAYERRPSEIAQTHIHQYYYAKQHQQQYSPVSSRRESNASAPESGVPSLDLTELGGNGVLTNPNLSDLLGSDYLSWSVDQVCQWLEYVGFSQYATAFAEHEITGDVLAELTEDNLAKLGMKIGPIKRFARHVNLLKRQQN